MTAPPGRVPTTAHRGASNRVIQRVVADRAFALARRAGVILTGRDVRELAKSFIEAADLPDDEQERDRVILERLMQQAPGGRKPVVRRHGLGGPGWRTAS
ncbi:hypothetical protein [Pimelobacter simplex]|uniref:hypothetical protein n=1 Tax=Nocardioides simplex TaxID=2045 RepID=UPI0008E77AC5|nr:hypothetical protein [Pimelobacter simplex]GEB16716.1 hypothetical protein NSI01_50310 [Pimelobacter simplex]SFM89578.1 hypothetical protein SAMN05421671_4069 [Pimelobacter simplex]